MNPETIRVQVENPQVALPGIEHLIARIETAEARITSAHRKLQEFLGAGGRASDTGAPSGLKTFVLESQKVKSSADHLSEALKKLENQKKALQRLDAQSKATTDANKLAQIEQSRLKRLERMKQLENEIALHRAKLSEPKIIKGTPVLKPGSAGTTSATGNKLNVTLPASAFIVTVNGKIPIVLGPQNFAGNASKGTGSPSPAGPSGPIVAGSTMTALPGGPGEILSIRKFFDETKKEVGRETKRAAGLGRSITEILSTDSSGKLVTSGFKEDFQRAQSIASRMSTDISKNDLVARGVYTQSIRNSGGDTVQLAQAKAQYYKQQADGLELIARNYQPILTAMGKEAAHAKIMKDVGSLRMREAEAFSRVGVLQAKVAADAQKFADANRMIGKNLLANTKHVTAWAAGVAVLYGSLNTARFAFDSMVRSGLQMERLRQVFRDNGVERLTDDVMRAAVANGRLTKEAMDSAIQWSRLGYNRVQVNEGVRVSLIAANVAEMTAAESTEHLSSLTQVYSLRVTELASVLSMLNHASNTYNTTNKQMLQGLTRTSAIAKQAGVPLAELIGIIGAGTGATGQTGANIGNAIKSIIGSISDVNKQEDLREMFQFEVTENGGAEIKTFSAILADLFVRYQELSRAEKQSLLFTVGGKQQASRMAAILDSYVKGQVLAIEAQLNLNSAQKENELIVATLHSQFAGLVAEFERFAHLQGQNGVSQGLTVLAQSLRNVLALMNAFPGGVTVIGGLLAAMAAKIALTAVQMDKVGKAGGVVKNTFAAVKQSITGLAPAIEGAIKRHSVMLDNWARGGPKGGIGGVQNNALAGMIGPQAKPLIQWQKNANGAWQAVQVGITGAGAAAGQAAPRIMLFRGAMALLSATMVELVLPMAIIGAGLWLLNKGAEAVGLSSATADDSLARLTQGAEEAKNAYEAAGRAIQFLATAQRTLAVSRDAGTRESLFSGISQIAFPFAGGDTEKQHREKERARAALLAEFKAAEQLNDEKTRAAKIDHLISQVNGQMLIRQSQQRRREYEQTARAIAEMRYELERLEGAPFATRNKKQDISDKLQELESRRIDMVSNDLVRQDNDLQAKLATDQKHLTYLEQEKAIVASINDIYDQLPAANRIDALNNEILKLGVIHAYHQRNKEVLEEQMKAQRESGRAVDSENLDKELKALQQKVVDLDLERRRKLELAANFQRGSTGTGGGTASPRAMELFEEARQLEIQKNVTLNKLVDAEKKLGNAGAVETDAKLKAKIKNETDRVKETERQMSAASVRRNFQETLDRRGITIGLASAEASSFAVGDTSGEQLTNQRRKLEFAIQEHQIAGATASAMNAMLAGSLRLSEAAAKRVDMENEYLTAAQLSKELDANRVRIAEEALNLQKEVHNETKAYQRTLMGAGPAELLRKLAISQLGRLGSGQFFALDPSARADYQSQPGNGQASRSLRDLLKNNPDLFGPDGKPNIGALQAAAAAEAARRGGINGGVPQVPIPENVVEVADSLATLRTNALGAADALGLAEKAAVSFFERVNNGGNQGPPPNPQSPVQ